MPFSRTVRFPTSLRNAGGGVLFLYGEVQLNNFEHARGIRTGGPHFGGVGEDNRGPQVNKFEQVQIVVTWEPSCEQTE